MSTAVFKPRKSQLADDTNGASNYLNAGFSAKSWLLTVDHKRIAILYLISITLFFFLGISTFSFAAWSPFGMRRKPSSRAPGRPFPLSGTGPPRATSPNA